MNLEVYIFLINIVFLGNYRFFLVVFILLKFFLETLYKEWNIKFLEGNNMVFLEIFLF